MATNASGLFVVLLLALATVIVVALLVAAFIRRGPKAVSAPVCGACGYQLAPNPTGLTVCPECGGDFLQVGILAPGMKLGRRGSPAVPLGIAWFILVGVGMVPVHGQLARAFTKMVNVGTATVTASGSGSGPSVSVSARREQVSGDPQPDSLEAEVTLTGADGKETLFTIDGKTKAVKKAPAGTGLVGAQWDLATAKKMVGAAGAEGEDQDEGAQNVKSSVDDAIAKSAGSPFGVVSSFTSSSFSSSFSGSSVPQRTRSRLRPMAASSSSYGGSTIPTVIIGPLRGMHWVTIITGVTGVLLAAAGLGVIVALTREKRRA